MTPTLTTSVVHVRCSLSLWMKSSGTYWMNIWAVVAHTHTHTLEASRITQACLLLLRSNLHNVYEIREKCSIVLFVEVLLLLFHLSRSDCISSIIYTHIPSTPCLLPSQTVSQHMEKERVEFGCCFCAHLWHQIFFLLPTQRTGSDV